MNIILFGPPGIGKSTVIGTLKMLGQHAIDLEDLYPNQIRYQIPNFVDNTFIGAADLSPARKYTNAKKVLLYTTEESYVRRRSLRDSKFPGKGKQRTQTVAEWIGTPRNFDWMIDTTNLSPVSTANKLTSLMKGDRHENQ